jgi:hypothetical protein
MITHNEGVSVQHGIEFTLNRSDDSGPMTIYLAAPEHYFSKTTYQEKSS